jgi:5-methylcytosine-specific restriction endonuclease McrA
MSSGSPLDCSVLVLNRFYMPVRVVNVRRAMNLLYRDCAEVITIERDQYCTYDFASWMEISQLNALEKQPSEDYLRTPHQELQIPRIVRLVRYDRVHHSAVRFNRRSIFLRDEHRCQYCGQTRPTSQLSLDHVVPRSLGGKTTWENIVTCCLPCNGKKGGRTPQQASMQLLSQPRRPATSPLVSSSLDDPRYQSWRVFLPSQLVRN